MSIVYHQRFRETELCNVISFHLAMFCEAPTYNPVRLPAFWWRIAEFQTGHVTELILLKCIQDKKVVGGLFARRFKVVEVDGGHVEK